MLLSRGDAAEGTGADFKGLKNETVYVRKSLPYVVWSSAECLFCAVCLKLLLDCREALTGDGFLLRIINNLNNFFSFKSKSRNGYGDAAGL